MKEPRRTDTGGPPKSGEPLALSRREVLALVDEVNEETGLALRLVRRFARSDGPGAYELASGDARFALKWRPDGLESFARAATATDFLRKRGYPAPEYLAQGQAKSGCYALQKALPGVVLENMGVNAGHVDNLLRLNALQADAPVLGGQIWPDPIVKPVLHGGDGFCLIHTMLNHSSDTASLLENLQSIVESSSRQLPVGQTDVVHFDFHAANVLAVRDRITGVVDWEAVHSGDRSFDLVTLAWYSPASQSQAIQQAIALSGLGAVRVYAAHMIHRGVEWSIRFYPHQVAHDIARARCFSTNSPAEVGVSERVTRRWVRLASPAGQRPSH